MLALQLVLFSSLSSGLVIAPPDDEAVPVQQPSAAPEVPVAESPAEATAKEARTKDIDWGRQEPSEDPQPAVAAVASQPAAPGPAPAPAAAPPPSADTGVVDEPRNGVGLLVAGPLTIAIGLPLSFAGNAAWRDNCGPTSTASDCAGGSTLSALSHTFTGLAYAGGIAMLAVGAGQRGNFDAYRHLGEGRAGDRAGLVVVGAVLLPASLIGMGMARLFFWLPTPDCMEYSCVATYQRTSTLVVGGLALTAGLGAGMFTYGLGYNRRMRQARRVAVLPQAGRGYAGLSLGGSF